MIEPLEIKTRMRFQDALRYNLYVAYSTTGNRIFCVLSIFSLGMFVYSMVQSGEPIDQKFAQSFALLVPPFIFFVMIPMKVWKATGALLHTDLLKNDAVYIFGEEKVVLRTPKGEADIPWDSYVRIMETRKDFRFFMDKVQAQIIPKYSLDEKTIKHLRDIIQQVVPKEAIKLRNSK